MPYFSNYTSAIRPNPTPRERKNRSCKQTGTHANGILEEGYAMNCNSTSNSSYCVFAFKCEHDEAQLLSNVWRLESEGATEFVYYLYDFEF
ncbi:hypothetical protein INT43_000430 [Umbelopsis isabellina]|uniref:Uncharacterized protein n=1 Tax=Mortierella isabellina TaxID=91625 RepID=A0A8H7UG50_MORIS|nr:hypothetical protein INT43_000430 [Umbelopsis isabellina]